MGKALIVEHVDSALYKARRILDTDALMAEKTRLTELDDQYWRTLNNALNHRSLLRADVSMYRETMNALIQQWQAALLTPESVPPPIVPEGADGNGNNPATGQPYTEEERATALEEEVLDKINATRVAKALSPFALSDTLWSQLTRRMDQWGESPLELRPELSANEMLDLLLNQQSIQDNGLTAQDILVQDAPGVVTAGITEMLVNGALTSDEAIAAMQHDPETWAQLMNPDATEAGVVYQYQPGFPGTHEWAVSAIEPVAAPAGNAAFFADPAGQALITAVETSLGSSIANGLQEGADGGSGGGGSGSGSWGEAWTASAFYGAGANVMGRRASGSCCLCQSLWSGLSGESEPLWPGPGTSIGDNELIWLVLSDIPDTTAALVDAWYGYG